ncbi:hypothetical protein Poli38472_003287 [Pythium oligandrum]|uniref:HECT-type E3 ubiquitin transferase n=1 Tax=Pythium oligandrum TaxID=41045 RepID=A0A8K1FF68_PYTOL|nr:hypothetical protein Poli38472_003287 [Pythium oligandrum]|eukprot:TMW57362.1 hypothetical protein Poli38472_003287 [Pythium oligandrum]
MDSATYQTALLYQAVGFFVALVLFFLWMRFNKRREVLEELRAPLLERREPRTHRIDAATKEAEAGYSVCSGCGFENFTRFSHCSLCGEKLKTADGVELKERKSNADDEIFTPRKKQAVTARQRRARKRREWSRKVGEDGVLKWQREDVVGAETVEAELPTVVVHFKSLEDPEIPEGEEQTVENALRVVADAHALELLSVADASADTFPNGFKVDDPARLAETLKTARDVFPSKYAHFVVCTASLIVPAQVEHLKLAMHRNFVLEESIDHLCCIEEKYMHSVMRITFLEESAVDAGGVLREWHMLLMEHLVDPLLKVFICRNASEQSYYLNPSSLHDIGEEHLKYYYAVGRLIGRMLLEGNVWGFHLSLPLLKIILGQPVSFEDLEYFDPELYKNLKWLLSNDAVDTLGLDFSVCEPMGTDMVVVDLIPEGRNVTVTDANKLQYVKRRFEYTLFESVSSQLFVFLKGVYEVIPQELLLLFDVEEFDYLLCGTDEIDVADWEAHTRSSLNLKGTRVMRWFWEEVAAMPNEYRRRLLHFATGSSRVPLGGFSALTSYDGKLSPFSLKGVSYQTNKYISSHSCFNRLELPLYKSRSELQTVLYAILDGEIYGFTTA